MSTAAPPWEGEPCFPADLPPPRPPEIVSVQRRDGAVLTYAAYKSWERSRAGIGKRTGKSKRELRREMDSIRKATRAAKSDRDTSREPNPGRPAKAPGRALDESWLLDGLEAAYHALDAMAGSPEAEECRRVLANLGERIRAVRDGVGRAVPDVVRAYVTVPARTGPRPPRADGLHYMPFGKYKDRLVADVAATDPDYLAWMLKNCKLSPNLRQHVAEQLEGRNRLKVMGGSP